MSPCPALTSLLLALTLAVPLAAQQPDSTRRDSTKVVELKPIEVVGSILGHSSPKVGSGVPARTTTINRDQIEASEPRLISDLLVTQAGISSYDDLGASYKMSLSSRGFFASPVVGLPQGVSVFLDGVRQNEPDAAQVNFDLLPMEHVTRVELLSGTASLLGRNSLGGAVNLVTNSGGGPTRGELEVSGGNFKTFGTDASLSGSLGQGRWSYYTGGGYDREDGWRQLTGAEQYNGFFNLGRLTERWGVRLQGYGAESRAETAGSLPETVFRTRPDSNLSSGDFEDLNSLQLAVSGYRRFSSSQLSFTAYGRRHRAERFNVNQAADPDTRGLSRNRIVGGTVDYRFERSLGGGTVGFRLGAEGSSARTAVELFADSTKFGGPAIQTTFVKSPTWDLAGYALADFTTGRATLSAGARYDYVRIPFSNELDHARDTSSSYSRLSPKVGVSFDLGHGLSAYGSVGGAFRAPAVIELACADEAEPCPLPFALGDDPPIKPVRATTFEVGGRLVAGPAILTGSAYRTEVRDDIFLFASDSAAAGSTIEGFFANIDKTRREGIELSAQVFVHGGHSLYANYAYTRATFQTGAEIFSIREDFGGSNDVEPGAEIPLVPSHQVKAGGSFQLPSGFFAGADGRYIGSQWLRGDEANVEPKLDGYVVADARFGWRGHGWEIVAVGNNILQNKYATFGTFNVNQGGGNVLERFLTPGFRRVVRLVVRRSFGGGDD
ncbi:MAG: TonB-dependent receptor [Gemmatimonadota bacterium]|nr:TonB-dependent receptor [Gemmatimonadota bacterium]